MATKAREKIIKKKKGGGGGGGGIQEGAAQN